MRYMFVIGLATLTGCTSLSTTMDATTSDSNRALTGVPYSLPMLQYELKVTRTLAQCIDPATKAPAMKFAVEATATPHYVSGETYVIDYRKLAGFTKVTAFSIEYQDSSNLLKSINASAEDKSVEIAGNVVKAAVGIASLASGIPLPSKAPDKNGVVKVDGMLTCAPTSQGLLDAVTLAAADVKTKSDALKKATTSVDELATRLAALSDTDKTELTKRVGLMNDATKTLATAQSTLEKAKDEISVVTTIRWPRQFDKVDEILEPDGVDLAKLVKLVTWTAAAAGPNLTENGCDTASEASTCIKRKLSVFAKLDRLSPVPTVEAKKEKGKPSRVQDASEMAAKGVFVRPPVYGRLLICGEVEQQDCGDDGPRLLLRADDAAIPQMGTLRFLPFTNGVAENNSLAVTLATSGDLTKVEYKTLKAPGETISAGLVTAINDIRGFSDGKTAKATADAKSAQDAIVAGRTEALASIQAQIDVLQKQKTLTDLIQPPALTATQAMQAQTGEINARIVLLQALLAQRQAEAALVQ